MEQTDQKEKKQPHPLRRLIITAVIGLLVAFSIMWSRGLFTAPNRLERCRIMSDGFFVAGIMLASVGFLIFVSQKGAFDAIRFSVGSFFSFLRNKETRDRYISYAEYKAKLAEKETLSCSFLILPGALLLVAAFICTMTYLRLEG